MNTEDEELRGFLKNLFAEPDTSEDRININLHTGNTTTPQENPDPAATAVTGSTGNWLSDVFNRNK